MAQREKGYVRYQQNAKKKKTKTGLLVRRSWLKEVTPKRGYDFSSDYFKIDNKTYGTILTIFSNAGADDDLAPMWGIGLIPFNLTKDVSTHLITQVERATSDWVEQAQSKADGVADSQQSESVNSGRRRNITISNKLAQGMDLIAQDIVAGDSYLHVAFKVMVKAHSLDDLDEGVKALTRYYQGRFASVYVEPFHGQQYNDFRDLLNGPRVQLGKNFGFTSSEFSGQYNLVTHGITDEHGKYVGQLKGDVNSSAVLWDMDNFRHHAVFAASQDAETISEPKERFNHVRTSAMWGTKIAQEALLNNHRVINFVLNDSQLNIGADLSDITTTVDLNRGEINPFEVFGSDNDELQAFSRMTRKIRLMTKQLNPDVDSLTLETLSKLLTSFFIDERLWVDNAQNRREEVRLVGLPHYQYPLMQKFRTFVKSNRLTNQAIGLDAKESSEQRMIFNIFDRMVTENGSLFNRHTADSLDNVAKAAQVIYDLSSLLTIGPGIAMAQFVNVLDYATAALQDGDVVIFHGTELIAPSVFEYTKSVINMLHRRDVRVVYLYDDVTASLQDHALADLSRADWLLFGKMTNPDVELLERQLGERLPGSLSQGIVQAHDTTYYLRRNPDNVVFESDLVLSGE